MCNLESGTMQLGKYRKYTGITVYNSTNSCVNSVVLLDVHSPTNDLKKKSETFLQVPR